MKNIQAVIFDMDGVLIDAKDWHYDALNDALALFGFRIDRFEHLSAYDGLSTRQKLVRLSGEKGLPEYLHSFINEMKQRYTMALVYQLCRPRFVHEYALSRLKAEGYRLAVASNSIQQTVDAMMEKADLLKYLEFTMSNEKVARPKPDPEIYVKTIDKLGLAPEQCLIVEDNENGIKAARGSGAFILTVREVEDVNYENIIRRIREIEEGT
jgi:beta-phosphoglucomutase-like phosphatase (HAD superfamily)